MLLTSTLLVTTSTQCGPISGAIAYWITKGGCFGTMAVATTATAAASVATAGAGAPVAAAAASAIPAAVAATEVASLSAGAFFAAIPFLP